MLDSVGKIREMCARADVEMILRLREAGAVERCHTTPHHGSYSVGAHSFGMAVLFRALYGEPVPARVYEACLLHDLHERWLGDVPGYVKHLYPGMDKPLEAAEDAFRKNQDLYPTEELTLEERRWFKAIDKLELYLWCHEQWALGNRHHEYMFRWLKRYLLEMDLPERIRDVVLHYEFKRTPDDFHPTQNVSPQGGD